MKLALPTPEEDANAPRPVAGESERLDDATLLDCASALLAADFGAADGSLLAEGFEFCGPVVGPLRKPAFLSALGAMRLREGLPDWDYRHRDAAVCPHDVNRVARDRQSNPRALHQRAAMCVCC